MRTQRGNECVKKTLKIVDFAASLPFRLRRTTFHLEETGIVCANAEKQEEFSVIGA